MAEKLTKDQIKQFKEGFAVFDKNGDGKITSDELSEVMKSIGQEKTPSEIQDMIKRVDIDGSGCLDIEEFIKMMSGTVGTSTEDISNACKVFDLEGNGFISAAELRHALTQFGKEISDSEIQRMMESVTQNKDGKVNYEEFVALIPSK